MSLLGGHGDELLDHLADIAIMLLEELAEVPWLRARKAHLQQALKLGRPPAVGLRLFACAHLRRIIRLYLLLFSHLGVGFASTAILPVSSFVDEIPAGLLLLELCLLGESVCLRRLAFLHLRAQVVELLRKPGDLGLRLRGLLQQLGLSSMDMPESLLHLDKLLTAALLLLLFSLLLHLFLGLLLCLLLSLFLCLQLSLQLCLLGGLLCSLLGLLPGVLLSLLGLLACSALRSLLFLGKQLGSSSFGSSLLLRYQRIQTLVEIIQATGREITCLDAIEEGGRVRLGSLARAAHASTTLREREMQVEARATVLLCDTECLDKIGVTCDGDRVAFVIRVANCELPWRFSEPRETCAQRCRQDLKGGRRIKAQPAQIIVQVGLDGQHAATQAKHQVQGRLLLNVVVGEGAAVLELLAGEDQALLIGRDALLVLNLGLDVVNRVRRLHLEGDRLAGEGLDKDLHATAQAEHEVKGRLLLDVVVREGAAVLELLAREDETLLVGRDPLLVLDLRLDVLDRVRGLDLERDRLARQRLDEDLHRVECVCVCVCVRVRLVLVLVLLAACW